MATRKRQPQQKPQKSARRLRELSFDEIAAGVPLKAAIEQTTPHLPNHPWRTSTAWHEATHVAAAGCFGRRTASYCIPQGVRVCGPVAPGLYNSAGMHTDHLSPEAIVIDEISPLEMATICAVGDVAEHVIASGTGAPPWCPYRAPITTDGQQAEANTREAVTMLGWLINQAVAAGLKPGDTQPYDPSFNPHAELKARVLQTSIAVVRQHFELIDAIAAILVLKADRFGLKLAPVELSDWVIEQTKLGERGRSWARSECAFPRPDWLDAAAEYPRAQRDYFSHLRARTQRLRERVLEAAGPSEPWRDSLIAGD